MKRNGLTPYELLLLLVRSQLTYHFRNTGIAVTTSLGMGISRPGTVPKKPVTQLLFTAATAEAINNLLSNLRSFLRCHQTKFNSLQGLSSPSAAASHSPVLSWNVFISFCLELAGKVSKMGYLHCNNLKQSTAIFSDIRAQFFFFAQQNGLLKKKEQQTTNKTGQNSHLWTY